MHVCLAYTSFPLTLIIMVPAWFCARSASFSTFCVLPDSGYSVSERMDGQFQSVTGRETVPQVIYGPGLAAGGGPLSLSWERKGPLTSA